MLAVSHPSSQERGTDSHQTVLVIEPIGNGSSLGTHVLPTGQFLLGSSADCGLILRSVGVSGRHCLILTDRGRSLIRALDADTWLNESRVREAVLSPGDRVTLGRAHLRVREATMRERWSLPTKSVVRRNSVISDSLRDLDVSPARVTDFTRGKLGDDSPEQTVLPQRAPKKQPNTPADLGVEELRDEPERQLGRLKHDIAAQQEKLTALLERHNSAVSQVAAQQREVARADERILTARRKEGVVRDLLAAIQSRAEELNAQEREMTKELARQRDDLSRRGNDAAIEAALVCADRRRLESRERELQDRLADLNQRRMQWAESKRHSEQQLARREREAAALQARLDRGRTDAGHRDEELRRQEQELRRQESEVARLSEQRLAEQQSRDDELASRKHELSARLTGVAQWEASLAERHRELDGRTQTVDAGEEELRSRIAEIERRRRSVAETVEEQLALGTALSEREREIERRQEQLALRSDEGEQRTDRLDERDRELDERHCKLDEQVEQHAALVQDREAEQARLDARAREFATWEESLANREHALARGKENVEALQAELNDRARRLDEREQELDSRRDNEQARADAQRAELAESRESQNEQFQIREQTLNRREQEISQLRGELHADRIELDGRSEEIAAEKKRLSEEREQLERGRQSLADAERQLEQELADVRDEEQQIRLLRRELADERETCDRQRRELESKNEELQTAHSEIESAHEEIRRERESLDEQQQTLNEARTAALTQEEQADRLRADLQQQQAAIESDREKWNARQTQLEADRAELESQRALIDSDRETLAAARSQLDAERESVAAAHTGIGGERESLDVHQEDAKARRLALDAEADRIQEERLRVEAERDGLRRQWDELAFGRERLSDGESDLAFRDARLDELRDQLAAERRDLEGTRSQFGAEEERLRREREELESQLQELQRQPEAAELESGQAQEVGGDARDDGPDLPAADDAPERGQTEPSSASADVVPQVAPAAKSGPHADEPRDLVEQAPREKGNDLLSLFDQCAAEMAPTSESETRVASDDAVNRAGSASLRPQSDAGDNDADDGDDVTVAGENDAHAGEDVDDKAVAEMDVVDKDVPPVKPGDLRATLADMFGLDPSRIESSQPAPGQDDRIENGAGVTGDSGKSPESAESSEGGPIPALDEQQQPGAGTPDVMQDASLTSLLESIEAENPSAAGDDDAESAPPDQPGEELEIVPGTTPVSESPAAGPGEAGNPDETGEAGPDVTEHENDEEIDSISAYMERLLARSRKNVQASGHVSNAQADTGLATASRSRKGEPAADREQSPAAQQSSVSQPKPPANAETARDDASTPDAPPPDCEAPLEPTHRQDKHAVRADMNSLRELANLSARTAIATHVSKKIRGKMIVKSLLTVISFTVAGVLLTSELWGSESYDVMGWAAAIIGIIMAAELARSTLLIHRMTSLGDSAGSAEEQSDDQSTGDGNAPLNSEDESKAMEIDDYIIDDEDEPGSDAFDDTAEHDDVHVAER